MAGEVTSVQIGHTGERLHNSAPGQPKHYVMHEKDLLERIKILMDDVDCLLVKLHALPAEIEGTDPVARPLDPELGRLFDIALRRNPGLDVPRSELAVLAARTRQAGAKLDPMLSLELMDTPAPLPFRPGDIEGVGLGVGVEQEFQSYGKRGLRRKIASVDEALKELELAQLEVDLMLEVTETYYTLFRNVARRRALAQNLELLRILVEMGERRLAIGTAPQAAVLSAQVQVSRMELLLLELEAEIEQGYIRLAGLLGYPQGIDLKTELHFDAAYPLPPQIVWDNGTLIPTALGRYPKYQRQCVMREQQNLMVEMAKREYYPDYMLMGRYEAAFGMQDSYSFEVRVPLFLNKEERQDAALQEQYAQKAVISDEAEATAALFISELESMQTELKMHGKLADLLRLGTVPQARLALESNIAAFAANMMEFNELIMAQQALLDQELELEQNYIHILHTLTDLHVLTLGAFDPVPHYASITLPAVAAEHPVAVGRRRSTAADLGYSITDTAPRMLGQRKPQLQEGESFVETLGIPGREVGDG